jgi:hypothetical protein
MDLRKLNIAPDNDLTHEAFVVRLPSSDHLDALVMKFNGVCGHGSGGNGDAAYMTAVTVAAISFAEPFALIFDFSELEYVWGDMMANVLSAGEDRWEDHEMPMAIVVSDRCEPALRSLLLKEMGIKDLSLITNSLNEALTYVDNKNTFGKRTSAV